MAKEGPRVPVINVVLPENFGLGAMYPNFPNASPFSLPAVAPPATVAPVFTNLLPANYTEGSKIDLATFCVIYTVAESIKQWLEANRITGSHAFSQLSDGDLRAMGFMIGEIIDLKEAIKEWAQAA